VQVHCDEGIAIHIGPEPCGGLREDVGEASVGECIGQPWSREKSFDPEADALDNAEGNREKRSSASVNPSGVVEDPGMCGSSLHGNREVSGLTCGWTPQVRIGKTRSRSR
jgi:hypothetical protein